MKINVGKLKYVLCIFTCISLVKSVIEIPQAGISWVPEVHSLYPGYFRENLAIAAAAVTVLATLYPTERRPS